MPSALASFWGQARCDEEALMSIRRTPLLIYVSAVTFLWTIASDTIRVSAQEASLPQAHANL